MNNYMETYDTEANQNKQTSPKKKRSFIKFMSIILLVVFSASAGYGTGYFIAEIPKEELSSMTDGDSSLTQTIVYETEAEDYVSPVTTVAMKAGPSVVTVISTKDVLRQGFFTNETFETEGTGSGVIYKIDEQGMLIITNYHVVNEASEVEIMFSSGETISGSVVGYDSRNDLALIQLTQEQLSGLDYKEFKPADFGDSEKLQQGELAIAMGNPLGKEFSQTVTTGVISAVDRTLTIEGVDLHVVQTDAAINPGNSGGALLNRKGEVIGINTAKLVDSSVEGMGFAIPTHIALPIIEKIESIGQGENIAYHIDDDKAFLGIQMVTSQSNNGSFGVEVAEVVEGGPADNAGIKSGDIIIATNDKRLLDSQELFDLLAEYQPGDTINLKILRDDNFTELNVQLGRYADFKDE